MSTQPGCFSPYMLISSTLQTVFGFERRSEQEKQLDVSERHQVELRRAKEEFQDESEAQRIADIRAKMAVARRYRSQEKFEQSVLQHKTDELRDFFTKYLPIKKKSIPILLEEAEIYREAGYDSSCPLNVVLFHTRQGELDYEEICDALDKAAPVLGNIVYQRWCDKDVAHNSGILNLHAIMGNIPTLVISPYFQGGSIHFNASMWEAQSETKPLIRPLFSIPCPQEYLGAGYRFTQEGRKAIQERISFISTIISGCARDSYMLMTQGLAPTLPLFLKQNPSIVAALSQPENAEVHQFMVDEYESAAALLSVSECKSLLLTQSEMSVLAQTAKDAGKAITLLTQ